MECPKDSRYRRYQLDLIRPVFTCLSSSGSTVTRRPRLRACLHHLGYDKAVDVDNAGSKISGSLVILAAQRPRLSRTPYFTLFDYMCHKAQSRIL